MTNTLARSEIEKSLIGSLFVGDCRKWELVAIEPDDFQNIVFRRIWKAARSLCVRGTLPDYLVAMAEANFTDQERKTLDPRAAIVSAVLDIPTDANVGYYCDKLKALIIEDSIEAIREESKLRLGSGDDTSEVLAWAEAEEQKVNQKYRPTPEPTSGDECYQILATALEGKQPEGLMYLKVPPLDFLSGGLLPGDYVVLAARPSCGKSSLALNVLVALARQGIKTTFFSLEMTRQAVFSSIAAIVTQVSGRKLLREPHRINGEERSRINARGDEVMRLANFITVYDVPGMKASEMAVIARREVRAGSRLLVVDHVHLTTEDGENETQKIGKFSKAWNRILKENHVAGIALAQLNRQNVSENREPRPSDLKQSGSLEEDADILWFLHPSGGVIRSAGEKIRVIQAKGRICGVGEAEAWFNGRTQTFSAVEETEDLHIEPRQESLEYSSRQEDERYG